MEDIEGLSASQQIEKLRHGDSGEKYYAAWWLGRMRAKAGIPALIEALADEGDRTIQGGYPLRRNAARALGKLADPVAIAPLIASLCCQDGQVTAAAAQALAEILSACSAPADATIAALQDWLCEHPQAEEAPLEAILEALGSLRAVSAIAPITACLEHASVRVQCAAARALYRITQDPTYAERLLPLLGHENIHLRRAALLDLGSTGYLPGAAAIAAAAVEVNIKLLALKAMMDLHLRDNPDPGPEAHSVLALLDALI